VLVVAQLVAHLAQLTGADTGKGERDEDDQDRLLTPEVREGDGVLVRIREGEIRSEIAHIQRAHRRTFPCLARVTRAMTHLPEYGSVVVWARPAVCSASATSLGSRYPSWPVRGDSSQMTPVSASIVSASTRPSVTSPSSSRHHSSTASTTSSELSRSISSLPTSSSTAERSSWSTSSS